jgi:hypothetical protein
MAEYTLPYRTDWQDMAGVLEYSKGSSGAERAALDARFGAGEAMRETLNALEQLGLAVRDDSGGARLTELGDRLAYAPGSAERSRALSEAILGYPPYRIPLERALGDSFEIIDAPWVEHVWQVDMRLGQPRNRVAEARTFFFRLADAAGIGAYRRGVRGQSTRLELAGDFPERIRPLLELRTDTQPEAIDEPVSVEQLESELRIDARSAPPGAISQPPATTPALSISVDLTDWDLERIVAFLKLVGYPVVE